MTKNVSISQARRNISALLDQVTGQGERIVLTSRGRPKAALIGLEDFARLQETELKPAGRAAWLVGAQVLAERIRQRRGGQDMDVDALIEANREDRDACHE